jgi:hypothetical protein
MIDADPAAATMLFRAALKWSPDDARAHEGLQHLTKD